jgi:hypothetical protein
VLRFCITAPARIFQPHGIGGEHGRRIAAQGFSYEHVVFGRI